MSQIESSDAKRVFSFSEKILFSLSTFLVLYCLQNQAQKNLKDKDHTHTE